MNASTIRTVESYATRAVYYTSPLPYAAVVGSALAIAFALVLAVLACYVAVGVAVCYLVLAPLARRVLAVVREVNDGLDIGLTLRSYRARQRVARFAALRRYVATRNLAMRAMQTRTALRVASDLQADAAILGSTDVVLSAVPAATLLPTEARRVALPLASSAAGRHPLPVASSAAGRFALPLASSKAGRFALPVVSAPAFVPAGLLSYKPAPVATATPAVESTADLYARLAAVRADLSAMSARLSADYAPVDAGYDATDEDKAPPVRTVSPAAFVAAVAANSPADREPAPAAPLAPATQTIRYSVVDTRSYRDLQAACKAAGKSAKGSAAVLRARLAGEAV